MLVDDVSDVQIIDQDHEYKEEKGSGEREEHGPGIRFDLEPFLFPGLLEFEIFLQGDFFVLFLVGHKVLDF